MYYSNRVRFFFVFSFCVRFVQESVRIFVFVCPQHGNPKMNPIAESHLKCIQNIQNNLFTELMITEEYWEARQAAATWSA